MSLMDDLNNLDPNNPGLWPLPIQLAAVLIFTVALIGAGWHFIWKAQMEELKTVQSKETEHRETFEAKQRKVANLVPLREQMKEMEQSFGDMLRQLPNKTEVAGLLVDISQTGLASGLEFEVFQPLSEAPTEFYAELPISIKVKSGKLQSFAGYCLKSKLDRVSSIIMFFSYLSFIFLNFSETENHQQILTSLQLNITSRKPRFASVIATRFARSR